MRALGDAGRRLRRLSRRLHHPSCHDRSSQTLSHSRIFQRDNTGWIESFSLKKEIYGHKLDLHFILFTHSLTCVILYPGVRHRQVSMREAVDERGTHHLLPNAMSAGVRGSSHRSGLQDANSFAGRLGLLLPTS